MPAIRVALFPNAALCISAGNYRCYAALAIAAATEVCLGVKAEGQSLDAISTPLAAHTEEETEAA